MSSVLQKLEIDQLMRMAFLNKESLKMLEEDGEIRGAIGDAYEFKAYKLKEYTTLYRVDIYDVGNYDNAIESLVFHKHSDKIPYGSPRKMEVYSFEVPSTARSFGSTDGKRHKTPTDGFEKVIVM
jgi:hypothetical protein